MIRGITASNSYYQPAATRTLGAASVSFSYSTSIRGPPAHHTQFMQGPTTKQEGGTLTFWFARIELRFSFPKRRFWFRCGF